MLDKGTYSSVTEIQYKNSVQQIGYITVLHNKSPKFDPSYDKVNYSVKTQRIVVIVTINLATCFGPLNHLQANS